MVWGSSGYPVNPGVSAERIDPFTPPIAANYAPALEAWANGDLGTPGEVGDNENPACPPPSAFCAAGVNSAGGGASIGHQGDANFATNDLVLTASGLPASVFGLFYFGPNAIQLAFGDGFRCVGGGTVRLAPVPADAGGFAAFPFDLTAPYRIGVILGMPGLGFLWYLFITLVVSSKAVRAALTGSTRWIDMVSGMIMIAFGGKLLAFG